MALNIVAIQLTPWLRRHQTQHQLLYGLCLNMIMALLAHLVAIGLLVLIYLVINSLLY